MRLPLGSRLQCSLRWRTGRAILEAYNRRDYELVLTPLDPEVEADMGQSSGGPIGVDIEGSWRGHSGFRRLWEQWDQAWDEFRAEAGEIIDFGDMSLVLFHFVGRGRGSGLEIRQPVAFLLTLRGGRLVRWQEWWDWDEALDAVGLPRSAGR
jgi:ketosteroid isomerase-like protein